LSAFLEQKEKHMSTKMNSVVHFEMPANDRKRMSTFYTKVFGWKMKDLGEEMNNYVLATTTESEEDGCPKRPGAINGGFFQKDKSKPAQYPSVVIGIEDIQAFIRKVNEAGGEVLGEPMEIPGVGQYVSFMDTEGNRVSMIQPTKEKMNDYHNHQYK
jgi:predicted enzyme related to lactoylglutathione lyase